MNKGHHSPGVYVEETSLLPKSVAQVETAVPAFIGYTKMAVFEGLDLHALNKYQPLEINSFHEFETIFGGAPEPASVDIELDNNNSVKAIVTEELCFMYYSVKLFFDNGGGTCLVVSTGNYTAAAGKVMKQQLLAGLAALEKTDAPTLLVIPDATKLSYAEAGEVHAAMLVQSGKHKNRFALLDLVNGNSSIAGLENPMDQFRFHLGMNNLSFGAAYYPWLITAYSRKAGSNTVVSGRFHKGGKRIEDLAELFRPETIDAILTAGVLAGERFRLNKPAGHQFIRKRKPEILAEALYSWLKGFYNLNKNQAAFNDDHPGSALHNKFTAEGSAFHIVLKRFQKIVSQYQLPLLEGNFEVDFGSLTFSTRSILKKKRGRTYTLPLEGSLKSLAAETEQLINRFYMEVDTLQINKLENLKRSDAVYNSVVNAIELQKIIVPPGGAVAGVIARVDRERGVWKAPANVSLSSVILPAVEVSQHDQENLNVDAVAGKSINAVRAFAGRGIMVWGARTLAGNDNEWRYVNVRRFFIMIEQSVHEAIRPFLFEKNDVRTWQKVHTMIANFLFSLWRLGALQGVKPEHAFFVKAGLGETMTSSDIENGIMNVEIGLAVIRPAEFTILKISNKMHNN